MPDNGRATITRAGYHRYIRSPEWQAVRKRYWASKLPKDCYCCGRSDGPKDLHHRTYKNLGNERLMDLVPVCRECHYACHDRLKTAPHKGLWWATNSIRKDRHPQFGRHSKLMKMTIKRTGAVAIECPKCEAPPGEPCRGERGQVRKSRHEERYDFIAHAVQD